MSGPAGVDPVPFEVDLADAPPGLDPTCWEGAWGAGPTGSDLVGFRAKVGATTGTFELWEGRPDQWFVDAYGDASWARSPSGRDWLPEAIAFVFSEYSRYLVEESSPSVGGILARMSPSGLPGLLGDPARRAVLRYASVADQLDTSVPLPGRPAYIADRAYNPIIGLANLPTADEDGKATGGNTLVRVLFGPGNGGLTKQLWPALIGLYPKEDRYPRGYALPLNWATAARLDVRAEADRILALPEDARRAVHRLADAMDRLGAALEEYETDRTPVIEALLQIEPIGRYVTPALGGLPGGAALLSVYAAVLVKVGSPWVSGQIHSFGTDLIAFAASLREAAREDRTYATAIRELILACSRMTDAWSSHVSWLRALQASLSDTAAEKLESAARRLEQMDQKALFGMENREAVEDLAATFLEAADHDYGEVSPTVPSNLPWWAELEIQPRHVPILHLPAGIVPPLGFEVNYEPRVSAGLRYSEFLNAVHPAVYLAWVLEMGASLLTVGAAAEGTWYAVGPALGSQTGVGRYLRGLGIPGAAEAAYTCWERACPGVSPGLMLRFLWRQAMTDAFLASVEARSLPCMYEVFCWMRTERRRFVLDAVLGSVRERGPMGAERGGDCIISILFSDGVDSSFCERWRTLGDSVMRVARASKEKDPGDPDVVAIIGGVHVTYEDPREIWLEFLDMVREQRDIEAGRGCLRERWEAWTVAARPSLEVDPSTELPEFPSR